VAEIAFAAADVFTEMIAAYRTGGKLPSIKTLSKKIEDLTAAPASEPQETSKPAARKSLGTVATGKKLASKSSARKSAGEIAGNRLHEISKISEGVPDLEQATAKSSSPPRVRRKLPVTAAQSSAAKTAKKVASLWTEYEKLAMTKAQAGGLSVYHVVVKIDPHCAMPIAGRQLIHNALGAVGQVIAVLPDAKSPAASKQVEFVLASAQTVAQISAKGRIPTIAEEVTVELLLAPSPAPQAEDAPVLAPKLPPMTVCRKPALNASETPAAAAPASAVAATQENLLRVEAGRIDSVLNLVGELIIGKSMLQQALSEFSKRYPKELLRGKFADAMAFQARVLNDLQRSVMKIRMVPVDQLFRRFPRMVRDVSRQCGREVELDTSAGRTPISIKEFSIPSPSR
jgi:chemotaxis protein histidine kinase CheA